MSGTFDDGWHPGARRSPSPNHDARPLGADVELALLHGISLPPGEFGGGGIEDLFLNRAQDPALEELRVSAHFLVRRDGELVQFVPCSGRAWHAGESEWDGRGPCNDFSVGIEIEGTDDLPYENAQYETLCGLLPSLRGELPSLCAVAGHCDVSPGRKTDPGPAFDWNRLFAAVGFELDGRRGRPR